VDAIPENITVTAMEDSISNQYRVFSADQYLVRLQRRQNFALAMQNGFNAYNNNQAGYTTSTTNTTRVSSNGTLVNSSTTTTIYDPSKVALLNAQSQQQLQQTANNYSNYNRSLSQLLIRDNTLLKGQSVSGYVMVKTSNSFSGIIYVDIPFGGEHHMFVLVPNL
jgi:flagellar hook protein FlgE